MLSGTTCKASETAGTAVLRIVVSSDSMKKATATSHGSSFLEASEADGEIASAAEAASLLSATGLVIPFHSIEDADRQKRERRPPRG